MKDLKERLEKISSCSDIKVSASLQCDSPNLSIQVGGRNSGRTLEMLNAIKFFSENLPEQIQKPRVLILGMNESVELSKHHFLFIEALKEANIDIVFMSNSIGSTGKIEIFREEPIKLNHSFEGSISGRHIPDIEMMLRNFRQEEDLIPDLVMKENFKYHDRKIPIKGRSSKKGKNNPQCGSNFHR